MSDFQPDYSPTINKTSSPITPTPPTHHRKPQRASSTKSIIGIALVSLLIAVSLMYANTVIRRETTTKSEAAFAKSVDLKLVSQNPDDPDLFLDGTIPNKPFDVQVIISDATNNTQQVAALDLAFIPTNLEILEIKPGPFFNAVGKHHLPNTTSHSATVLKLEPNRIALGAACDYCYEGDKPSDPEFADMPACSNDAGCYAKTANGQVVAILTVKAPAVGEAKLDFDPDKTQVAVLDGTDNPPQESAVNQLVNFNILVEGAGGNLCTTYDFNNQNGVDLMDAMAVITRMGNVQGDNGYEAKYDFNGINGIDLMDAMEIIPLIGTLCE